MKSKNIPESAALRETGSLGWHNWQEEPAKGCEKIPVNAQNSTTNKLTLDFSYSERCFQFFLKQNFKKILVIRK